MSNQLQSLTTLVSGTLVNRVIQEGYKNLITRHSSSKTLKEAKEVTHNIISRSHSCLLKTEGKLLEPKYKHKDTENTKYTNVITELIMEIEQSINYEDIKEPIASSIKIFHTPSKLLHKLTFKSGANFVGEEKCKCGKDAELPCCVKARNWIRMMFEKKGKRFPYEKYKTMYEVHCNTNLIENVGDRRKEFKGLYASKERFKPNAS